MRKVLVVLAALLMITPTLFGQADTKSHAVVLFLFGSQISDMKTTAGSALIDLGDGKPTEQKYDSLARLIDELSAKGWDLKELNSLLSSSGILRALLFFEKK